MVKRSKWLRRDCGKDKRLLIILALAATLPLIMVFAVSAAFTFAPTLDLTASSSMAGATATYTFHIENPDLLESVSAYSVVIPAGYAIDPAYLTTTPNIEVPGFTGSFGFIGGPPLGSLKVKTTAISGQFNVYGYIPVELLVGTVSIVPPTSTIPGAVNGLMNYINNGIYVDLIITVVNPSAPGVYTWGPNAATPWGGGANASMDPRPGFTNQVEIVAVAVGGHLLPVNKSVILAPYIAGIGIALIGLIGAVSLVYVTMRRHRA